MGQLQVTSGPDERPGVSRFRRGRCRLGVQVSCGQYTCVGDQQRSSTGCVAAASYRLSSESWPSWRLQTTQAPGAAQARRPSGAEQHVRSRECAPTAEGTQPRSCTAGSPMSPVPFASRVEQVMERGSARRGARPLADGWGLTDCRLQMASLGLRQMSLERALDRASRCHADVLQLG
jgi:hypothetical protein